jgi:hypothetical protein
MAEFSIGADWIAALEQYLEGLGATTQEAGGRASEYLYNQTVTQARQHERWADVADQIEVWSQDGYLIVGVRDEEYTSEAFNIEYGDEVTPPDPLFRTMTPMAEGISKVMGQTFAQFYGGTSYAD